MLIQNTKKSPGFEVVVLTVRGRWEWVILAIWIVRFLYFYFVRNLWKEIMLYVRIKLKLPPLLNKSQTLLAEPRFPPSERTFFMDDPQQAHFLIFKQKCIYLVLHMFYFAWSATFYGVEFFRYS